MLGWLRLLLGAAIVGVGLPSGHSRAQSADDWIDITTSPSLVLDSHRSAKTAWQDIVPQRHRTTRWIYELEGNTSSVWIVPFEARYFALGSACAPGDCYDNGVAYMIALDSSVAYGAVSLVRNGRTLPTEFFGSPPPEIQALLQERVTEGRQ